jgi:precorrin-8X/cobalt-precorrin-8 methylmutase
VSPLFDSYLMVDWSARSSPSPLRESKDAIWMAAIRDGGPADAKYVRTRQQAVSAILDFLSQELSAKRRVLAGFDFPFGYPAGVAGRITGRACALALWDWLGTRIVDGPGNANNRFEVASEINRLYDGTGPFWGRPAGWHHPDVPFGGRGRRGGDHPPERRLADRTAKGAKTVWQLAGAGSVGSQVLLGLPALARLRKSPALAERCAVWPFETGLAVPEAPVVLAEIYPSLFAVSQAEGEVPDAAQVRTVAERLRALDAEGALAPMFAGPATASAAERTAVATEEAWILGLGHEHLLGVADAPRARAGARGRPCRLRYERDPAEIYRRSFAAVRAAARLDHLPADLQDVAVRLVHACGMPDITARLAWSSDLVEAARAALAAGAPVLCDCQAVASMVTQLPGGNAVLCTLGDERVPKIAGRLGTTRSAAAIELWRDRVDGAVVVVGNAPTALFRLLELIDDGWPRPAAILGFPVGFVGAAESKAELGARPRGVPFLTLRGRRGGSAMAAAAVNALARPEEVRA